MANIPGTNLAAGIVPFTSDDTYPTHYAMYGKGGHRTVQSIVNRNSIPTTLKEEGMTVFVLDDNTKYTWKKNPNNSNIVEWLSDANINAVGTNTQVIFNDNGVLAGNSDFTYDKSTKRLRILSYLDFRQDNLYLGNLAGNSNPNNSQNTQNVGIGYRALQNLTHNALNVAIGSQALSGSTDARGTVAIGKGALGNSNAQFSVAIGYEAGASRGISESGKLDIENSSRIDSLIEGDFSDRWVRFNGAIRKRVVNNASIPLLHTGSVTTTSLSSDQIIDSVNIPVNNYGDFRYFIVITSGKCLGQFAKITGKSEDRLLLDNGLTNIPILGDNYKIVKSLYLVLKDMNSEYFIDLTSEDYGITLPNYVSSIEGTEIFFTVKTNPNNKRLLISSAYANKILKPGTNNNFSMRDTYQRVKFTAQNNEWVYSIERITNLKPISTTTKDIQIDLNTEIYKLDVATATTVTLNVDSYYIPILTNNALTIELHINMTSASLMTFPVNVSWVGGSAPAFNAINNYRIDLRTMNAGTTWLAEYKYTY